MTGIYLITNVINGKHYVGQSVDINKRVKRHFTDAVNPDSKGYDYPLYRAMRKYGIEYFGVSVLEECLIEQLNEREIYWIKYYNSFYAGYNQTLGGDSAAKFNSLDKDRLMNIRNLLATSQLTQKVIAEQNNISEEMVQGINTGRYWKDDSITYPIRQTIRRTKEEKVCIECSKPVSSAAARCLECENKSRLVDFGRPLEDVLLDIYNSSFVVVAKQYGISDNALRHRLQNRGLPTKKKDLKEYVELNILHIEPKDKIINSSKPKPVIQYDLNNNYLNEFPSTAAAGRAIGKPDGGSHIGAACAGKRQTAYGYKWKFKNEI